jgi:hypothetical protein
VRDQAKDFQAVLEELQLWGKQEDLEDKEWVKLEFAHFLYDRRLHSDTEVLKEPSRKLFQVVSVILQAHLA